MLTVEEAREIIYTACTKSGITAAAKELANTTIDLYDRSIASGMVADGQVYNGHVELMDHDGHCVELPTGYYGNAITGTDYTDHAHCGAEKIDIGTACEGAIVDGTLLVPRDVIDHWTAFWDDWEARIRNEQKG